MAEWEDALEQCQTIHDLIDDEVPDWARDKSPDFFEGVGAKVSDMADWIEENKHVTDKMIDSLENMERGVKKWIKD